LLTLICGGSGSGKSVLAERLLAAAAPSGRRFYLATMRPDGREAGERIRRHRARRAGSGFITLERYAGLADLNFPEGAAALLECLGNLAANLMFPPSGGPASAPGEIWRSLERLRRGTRELIVVTNEIFSDGEDYSPETENYRTVLAEANRRLGECGDRVVEMVCGLPLVHKGELPGEPLVSPRDFPSPGQGGGMILVVGGRGAGKMAYVKSAYGYADSDISAAEFDSRPVLADLQSLVREKPVPPEALLPGLMKRKIIICDEVGCGVVPLDPGERAWRDRVGRLCALLAARADRVIRVCCGLPVFIKGGAFAEVNSPSALEVDSGANGLRHS
jgi:adenosylcobinamide kinase/adenosylcobinamide-phosphate guanylyltransferase